MNWLKQLARRIWRRQDHVDSIGESIRYIQEIYGNVQPPIHRCTGSCPSDWHDGQQVLCIEHGQ